jgi:hypothetical protein
MAWFHRLSEINEETRTATCSECGPVRIVPSASGKLGWRCNPKTRPAHKQRVAQVAIERKRAYLLDKIPKVEAILADLKQQLASLSEIQPDAH